MSFKPGEIAAMLTDYEHDQHTGMDIPTLSQLIYEYGDGYPYLVSGIYKLIDEDFDREWTGGQKAVRYIMNQQQNTLLMT
jgi:hypothetical protein